MRRGIEQLIVPQALIILSVAAAMYSPIWYLILIAFMLTLAIYIWRGYDPRFLIGIAILLLLVGAIMLAVRREAANQVATYAYYFLATGIAGELLRFLKERQELK